MIKEKFLDSKGLDYYTSRLLKRLQEEIVVDPKKVSVDLSGYIKVSDLVAGDNVSIIPTSDGKVTISTKISEEDIKRIVQETLNALPEYNKE